MENFASGHHAKGNVPIDTHGLTTSAGTKSPNFIILSFMLELFYFSQLRWVILPWLRFFNRLNRGLHDSLTSWRFQPPLFWMITSFLRLWYVKVIKFRLKMAQIHNSMENIRTLLFNRLKIASLDSWENAEIRNPDCYYLIFQLLFPPAWHYITFGGPRCQIFTIQTNNSWQKP